MGQQISSSDSATPEEGGSGAVLNLNSQEYLTHTSFGDVRSLNRVAFKVEGDFGDTTPPKLVEHSPCLRLASSSANA